MYDAMSLAASHNTSSIFSGGSSASAAIYESSVVKLPKRGLGFPRSRYLVLTMAGQGRMRLKYYTDEFAWTSFLDPLESGSCDILPSTVVKPFDGPFQHDWCLVVSSPKAASAAYAQRTGVAVEGTYVFFRCESEESRKAWMAELTRAVAYVRKKDVVGSTTGGGAVGANRRNIDREESDSWFAERGSDGSGGDGGDDEDGKGEGTADGGSDNTASTADSEAEEAEVANIHCFTANEKVDGVCVNVSGDGGADLLLS